MRTVVEFLDDGFLYRDLMRFLSTQETSAAISAVTREYEDPPLPDCPTAVRSPFRKNRM
jgi:hypothetical protein